MVDDFNDFLMDAKLGIKTTGRNDEHSDTFRYPYEPTAYAVMDRIIEEEYIGPDDYLVDYGSGMGRVPIYMNYRLGCRAVGVEMVEEFWAAAEENLAKYRQSAAEPDIRFECAKAEEWIIPDDADCLFFFNPFSVKIMRGVMDRILESYYLNPRKIKLMVYYPQDEYMGYFSTVDEIDFLDEIDCMDLFKKQDARNRVMVFEIGSM